MRRSRRARSPAGLPRISWRRSGSSSMRSSRIASRSAEPDRGEERVEPRLDRVLAQQGLGRLLVGVNPQLLVRAVERDLGPLAQLERAARDRRDDEHALRPGPAARRGLEPHAERLGPPRPGRAEDEQRAARRARRRAAAPLSPCGRRGARTYLLAWPRWRHPKPRACPPTRGSAPAGGWSPLRRALRPHQGRSPREPSTPASARAATAAWYRPRGGGHRLRRARGPASPAAPTSPRSPRSAARWCSGRSARTGS